MLRRAQDVGYFHDANLRKQTSDTHTRVHYIQGYSEQIVDILPKQNPHESASRL